LPLLEFVVLALATWRITSLISEEEGPGKLLLRLRHMLGVEYDEHSYPVGRNELARMVICGWCLSVWVGLAWTLFYVLAAPIAFWCALPFAFSTVAVWVSEHGTRFSEMEF